MEKMLHFHLSLISNRQAKLMPMIDISTNLETITQKTDEMQQEGFILAPIL
jgi:hypothetical protein